MEEPTLHAMPYWFSLAAALIKIMILAQVATRSKLTASFNMLAITFITSNALEFLVLFLYDSNPELGAILLRLYMASLIALGAFLANFIAIISQPRQASFMQGFFFALGFMIVGLLATDLIITGAERIRYSVVSIEGPGYALFSFYLLAVITSGSWCLVQGIRSKVYLVSVYSKVTLAATLLIFVTGVIVISAKFLGLGSTAAIAIPFSTTLFVWILLQGQKSENAIITFHLKWIRARFFAKQIWVSFKTDQFDFASYQEQSERLLLTEALKYCKGNYSAVARLLGTNQSKISRMARKMEQDLTGETVIKSSLTVDQQN